MDIHITVHGKSDLAGQVYRQLRDRIMDGQLVAGDRLPSTRALALQLGVSRKTTLEAFERLISEGYLHSQTGNGTFVAQEMSRISTTREPTKQSHVRPHAIWDEIPMALAMPKPEKILLFDFRGGVTDKKRFPFTTWRRCMNAALRIQMHGSATYRDPAGEQELRLAISRYLSFNRAVICNWQDVIVTQGAQQAIDLIARVMLKPGDIVAMEDPGYPPARACFTALGATIVSVPIDESGLITAKLPQGARLVYTTPSHQFPLGMPMSLERRIELLEWAQREGALIIEDDYDSEFRFEGRPMESLKSLDRSGSVAYIGTFSKTIFPELRVGYIIPPASLNHTVQKAKQISDWHTCSLTQAALARFMLDGDFAKHLRRVHKYYAARRLCIIKHLTGDLAPWFENIVEPAAGIHLSAIFKHGITQTEVIAEANAKSIALYGIAGFYKNEPAQQGLLFGYGGITVEQIDIAMLELKQILINIDHRKSKLVTLKN